MSGCLYLQKYPPHQGHRRSISMQWQCCSSCLPLMTLHLITRFFVSTQSLLKIIFCGVPFQIIFSDFLQLVSVLQHHIYHTCWVRGSIKNEKVSLLSSTYHTCWVRGSIRARWNEVEGCESSSPKTVFMNSCVSMRKKGGNFS